MPELRYAVEAAARRAQSQDFLCQGSLQASVEEDQAYDWQECQYTSRRR